MPKRYALADENSLRVGATMSNRSNHAANRGFEALASPGIVYPTETAH